MTKEKFSNKEIPVVRDTSIQEDTIERLTEQVEELLAEKKNLYKVTNEMRNVLDRLPRSNATKHFNRLLDMIPEIQEEDGDIASDEKIEQDKARAKELKTQLLKSYSEWLDIIPDDLKQVDFEEYHIKVYPPERELKSLMIQLIGCYDDEYKINEDLPF